MAEIGRLVGRALHVDEHRQIAGQPHRVHVVEEERAVAAEQVLHIVLRGRDQDVEAGLIHDPVEPGRIERNGGAGILALHHIEHRSLQYDADRTIPGTQLR